MEIQTVVKHLSTGRKGVVVPDTFDCCSSQEVAVVFEGETVFMGVSLEELEEIGPENAVADFKKCGAGQGDKCCIFFTREPDGFECDRFGSLRNTIIFRKETMKAKREPTALYPECQLT